MTNGRRSRDHPSGRRVEYSTDLANRTAAVTGIAMVSGVLAFPLFGLLDQLTGFNRVFAFVLSLFLGPPLVFRACYDVYDRWLWRQALGRFRFSRIPDLSGAWEGYVTIDTERRPEEGSTRLDCHVVVHQTWSTVSLAFQTDFTTSVLTMASVNAGQGPTGGLRYEFLVTPRPESELARSGMVNHLGTAHLEWDDDDPECRELRGQFYTGPGYHRYGEYVILRSERSARDWRRSRA